MTNEMPDVINVMGLLTLRKPASPASHISNQNGCLFLERGFCETCTCSKCDHGMILKNNQGRLSSRPCKCRDDAINRKHIRESGLEELIEKCTFDRFSTRKPWQSAIKSKALAYLKDRKTMSFFMSGQSGCGKTHLCTAICSEIMRAGDRLKYFQWVKDGTRLKQLANDHDRYEAEIRPWIESPYLYIDDLFKPEPSPADVKLCFAILDERCKADRPTIISTERSLTYIKTAQGGEGEALAGRIFESCGHGQYCLELSGSEKNMRFRQGSSP